jgi:hypothetical protein
MSEKTSKKSAQQGTPPTQNPPEFISPLQKYMRDNCQKCAHCRREFTPAQDVDDFNCYPFSNGATPMFLCILLNQQNTPNVAQILQEATNALTDQLTPDEAQLPNGLAHLFNQNAVDQ